MTYRDECLNLAVTQDLDDCVAWCRAEGTVLAASIASRRVSRVGFGSDEFRMTVEQPGSFGGCVLESSRQALAMVFPRCGKVLGPTQSAKRCERPDVFWIDAPSSSQAAAHQCGRSRSEIFK